MHEKAMQCYSVQTRDPAEPDAEWTGGGWYPHVFPTREAAQLHADNVQSSNPDLEVRVVRLAVITEARY